MKVNPTLVFILIITTLLIIHTPVYSYLTITLALGRSEIWLISWPSHSLFKVSSPVVMGWSHPSSSGMPLSGSKILYHHVHYERDYCH